MMSGTVLECPTTRTFPAEAFTLSIRPAASFESMAAAATPVAAASGCAVSRVRLYSVVKMAADFRVLQQRGQRSGARLAGVRQLRIGAGHLRSRHARVGTFSVANEEHHARSAGV